MVYHPRNGLVALLHSKGVSMVLSLLFLVRRHLTYTYTHQFPYRYFAFDQEHPWFMQFVEIVLLGAGSLCLFSIFVLILVYWADIL